MVDCIACDLSCRDEHALERHWDLCHPSLASINRSVKDVQVTVSIVHSFLALQTYTDTERSLQHLYFTAMDATKVFQL